MTPEMLGISGTFVEAFFEAPLGVMHYLILAFILFAIGLLMVISIKNLIRMLIGVELMLNAVCLNFAAINVYSVHINHSGQIFTVFIMAIAAIELAVAIVLFTAAFRQLKTINSQNYKTLKEEV